MYKKNNVNRVFRSTIKSKENNKSNVILVSNFDYMIFLSVILLVVLGITMVFSSSYHELAVKLVQNPDSKVDIFSYLKSQALYACIGLVTMLGLANFNYTYLKKYGFPLYILSIVLLAAVPFVGVKINGAQRWLRIFGISVQPSEIAKLAIIIYLSYLLSKYKNVLSNLRGYIFIGGILLIPFGLIALENKSTALIMLIIGGSLMFLLSPHTKIFVFGGITGFLSLVVYFIFFTDEFRSGRFWAWIDPFSDRDKYGFQAIQSLYAISSGGLFGLGLGQSRQKLGFIPEPQNDMIFAIICEELGFFGAALLLILFATFIWRGIKTALNAPDLFGTLLATGVTVVIGAQVLINVAVATNSIPNTGIPLPFISAGGTSLVIFMSMVGILLNISRYTKS